MSTLFQQLHQRRLGSERMRAEIDDLRGSPREQGNVKVSLQSNEVEIRRLEDEISNSQAILRLEVEALALFPAQQGTREKENARTRLEESIMWLKGHLGSATHTTH